MSRLRAFIPFILLAAGGCVHQGTLKPVDTKQARRVITRLTRARQGVKTIHVRMHAAIYGHGKARKGRMDVFAKADKLRAEVWGPTDNLLDLIVVCGERFMHLSPGKKRCITGNTDRLKALPLPLPQKNLPALLAGLGPEPKNATVAGDDSEFVLNGAMDNQKYTVNCSMAPITVNYYAIEVSGHKTYRIRQSRFRDAGGFRIPGRIRISLPGMTAVFKYKKTELNVPLGDDVFDCKCPPGDWKDHGKG